MSAWWRNESRRVPHRRTKEVERFDEGIIKMSKRAKGSQMQKLKNISWLWNY